MKKQPTPIDPRHYPIRAKIDELYQARYHVSVPNWPALVKGLSIWLHTVPQWSLSVCLGCVENRFKSTFKPNLPPHSWVRHLSDYMTSPLDPYYQPLPDKPVPRRIFQPAYRDSQGNTYTQAQVESFSRSDPASHENRRPEDPRALEMLEFSRRELAKWRGEGIAAWERRSHETGKPF